MIPSWPAARLGELIESLARLSGHEPAHDGTPRAQEALAGDAAAQGEWIEATARWLGLETERVHLAPFEVARHLRECAPALLRTADGNFVAILEDGRVLGPGLSVHRVTMEAVAALLVRTDAAMTADVDALFAEAGVAPRKRARATQMVMRECASDHSDPHCWALRVPPTDFWQAVRKAGLPSRAAFLVAAHAVEYAIWIASWWLVGESALQGRFDAGLLTAWALLLITLVPLRALTTWLHGTSAIAAGGLLKERLLAGALRLDPEEVRHLGAGQMLGRVIESDALEALALNGGIAALMSLVELAAAGVVVAAGAGGLTHLLLLLAWSTLTLTLAWRYVRTSRGWTTERLRMTQDLVERMVGHRTRLAQEAPEHWHEGEDRALERYLAASCHVDGAGGWITAVPFGWLIVSLATLAYPFVSGSSSTSGLAVAIGGTLLGVQAFRRLTTGLWNVSGAAIAWEQVGPLFQAASRHQSQASPDLAVQPAPQEQQTIVELQNVGFRYKDHTEAVLRGCSLRIANGDRLLLEGPSGCGKSTVGSLLAGLRAPDSGLLLAGGLDRYTLGVERWRRVVALAPQFHDNHVLSGPFAFNLLMGRDGVLDERNLEEAESICGELGLRELLVRMPAGIMQLVGESGWQLSHGEQSRLFIARAILQRAELIVLDESFAALDPTNLQLAIDCVARHAPAALVIAHR